MAINRNLVAWSRTIHIYLSIALLLILVFFSVTGITLNHAESLTAAPEVTVLNLETLPELPRNEANQIIDSPQLETFLREEFGIKRALAAVTYEEEFLVVDYQAPGKTAFVEIDQELGEAYAETTDYGLIAVLNDLHKARDTEVIWDWFVDISAVILVVFSLAGFILLLPNNYRFKRVVRYTAIAAVLLSAGYYLGTF